MPKKSQRERDAENRSTGSLLTSLVLALCFALLGFVLGVTHLALMPVQTVRKLPAQGDRDPRVVYYVQPSGGSAPTYQIKENTLYSREGGTVSVSADELNTWATNTFRFARAPEGTDEGGVVLIPSSPRFNLTDGSLNMAVMLEVRAYGKTHKVLFQTQGAFERGADGVVFVPQESYLGSAKLPPEVVTPLVNNFIYDIFASSEAGEALLEAWDNLSDVRIEGNTLQLVKG
ncbi:hypothetical protein H5P28_02540 [Ruficoccus amylovorans]|uniref:Uncharacterized protein n=1 Tax=Ruficoccus amylovorans TaxID=1804625 RepID=A0A842H9Z5_9BACT|nr:hypothetical protein [Ruficoccus amylovorans]MBC2593130.1 hypothetical protein [Ruficoccus amylovorans]